MKIAKALLVDPDRNQVYGSVAVALSVVIFAYSSRFGPISILAYYALWLPLVLVNYRQVLGNYARYSWILAFGLVACLSTFWSAAPPVTARAAVQYMTHVVCALIAARIIGTRTLACGVVAGVCLVLLYSLAIGNYFYDPLDGTYSFVGAFSSKNQLGFYASLGIYFSFSLLFVLRERRFWAAVSAVGLLLSGYSLFASQSATSVIATAGTLAMSLALALALRFTPNVRRAMLAIGVALAVSLAFVALNAGGADLLLSLFGKDATLTGRTYLWGEGLSAAAEAPVFGIGYQAFWVPGFFDAERLWDDFFITSRSGFHFHNTYIAMLVEVGAVGTLLLCLVLLRTSLGFLRQLVSGSADATAQILFGLLAMLLIRSLVELDMVNPYAVGAFLLYYAAGRLASARRRVGQPLAAPVVSRPPVLRAFPGA